MMKIHAMFSNFQMVDFYIERMLAISAETHHPPSADSIAVVLAVLRGPKHTQQRRTFWETCTKALRAQPSTRNYYRMISASADEPDKQFLMSLVSDAVRDSI